MGLDIRKTEGRAVLTLTDDAFADLGETLLACYDAVDPGLTAKQVVGSWLESLGPADVEMGETIERVRRTAVWAGFRELGATAEMLAALHRGKARWDGICERNSICQSSGVS